MQFWGRSGDIAPRDGTARVLSTEAMRAAENAAISARHVTGTALMEAAGKGVIRAIAECWPELCPGKAVVLAGPGNNGGDGFVIARLLAGQGWQVRLFLLGDPAHLPEAAAFHAGLWSAAHPVTRIETPDDPRILAEAADATLLIDALFGIGLSRPVAGLAALAQGLARHRLYRVAVDLPTGLGGDSGRAVGDAVLDADLTVTFHAAKPGHFMGDGPAHCGRLAIADIGLPTEAGTDTAHLVTAPPRHLIAKQAGHKYDHGHALIIGGPSGACGAARLAARAALRIGAGLVTLAPEPAALSENAARLDAVMLAPLMGARALRAMLADQRLNAICIGPGLGLGRARDLVPALLATGRRAVLDADALSAFADHPETLFTALHPDCILTPHGGEFARLFPDLAARLHQPESNPLAILHEAASRAGCNLLLKGPATIIASPEGATAIHAACYHQAAPGLATAGSGDVLAGMVTGLLARGFPPCAAASMAVWLHAAAARAFGPGLIAEDLPDLLPAIIATLPEAP